MTMIVVWILEDARHATGAGVGWAVAVSRFPKVTGRPRSQQARLAGSFPSTSPGCARGPRRETPPPGDSGTILPLRDEVEGSHEGAQGVAVGPSVLFGRFHHQRARQR